MNNTQYPGTILITGASGGIGFQVASQLLERGIRDLCLVYYQNGDNLIDLCKKYDLEPNQVLHQANLTQENEVIQLFEKIQHRNPKIWALLNIAGGSTNSMLWKLSLSDFTKVLEMNLISTFLMSRSACALMRNQAFGRIVNFSSVVAQNGIAGASHYCASKAAIEGFTKASAVELAKKNILVNALALGYYEYGLIKDVPEPALSSIIQSIPMSRLGKIEDLFPAIQYLIDPAQNYVTGQVLHVSGGLRFS